MYNASQWKLPNNKSWFQGRFSNGRVWTEYLAELLNVPLYNWAIGGAAVDDTYIVIPGLKQEVDSWVEYMIAAKDYNPEQSLFTILIGGNDLVNYERNVDEIVADLTSALQNLIEHGAKHIILLNLPDVSKVPVFSIGRNIPNLKVNINKFNTEIANLVKNIKQTDPNVEIILFDTYELFNQAIDDPVQFGLINTNQSCLKIDKDSSITYVQSHNVRNQCTNASKFIFWDVLHITSNMHKILATKIVEQLEKLWN